MSIQPGGSQASCREELQPDWIADTVEAPTQLGAQLNGNPYSVSVMQQTAVNLYGSSQGITANKKYIRYKPATLEQVDILNEDDNIELFDYPLDQDVVEEGSYYPQAGIGETEIPWLYSVVDISYQPVAGIQYEQLADLYVPDTDTNLEDEAFRITNNEIDPDCAGIDPSVPQCLEGYHWDWPSRQCVPDNCRMVTTGTVHSVYLILRQRQQI